MLDVEDSRDSPTKRVVRGLFSSSVTSTDLKCQLNSETAVCKQDYWPSALLGDFCALSPYVLQSEPEPLLPNMQDKGSEFAHIFLTGVWILYASDRD